MENQTAIAKGLHALIGNSRANTGVDYEVIQASRVTALGDVILTDYIATVEKIKQPDVGEYFALYVRPDASGPLGAFCSYFAISQSGELFDGSKTILGEAAAGHPEDLWPFQTKDAHGIECLREEFSTVFSELQTRSRRLNGPTRSNDRGF